MVKTITSFTHSGDATANIIEAIANGAQISVEKLNNSHKTEVQFECNGYHIIMRLFDEEQEIFNTVIHETALRHIGQMINGVLK